MFSAGGVPATYTDLSPDFLAGYLNSGALPFGRRIYRTAVSPVFARLGTSAVRAGDTAWFLEPAIPLSPSTAIEESIKRRGASYVFHVMDDWFSIPYLKERTIRLCRLADLVVVPTPGLLEKVSEMAPGTNAIRLEEPIDTDRVFPMAGPETAEKPLVVWCGGPVNMRFLHIIRGPMEAVFRKIPFKLRIVSGQFPKDLHLNLDWEWKKYDYTKESGLLAGAVCGLAPMDDSPYNRCKGAYKIKTYLAAGLPVLASPVGYQNHLVQTGKNGFLPENDAEWAGRLIELLQDGGLAETISRNARQCAENIYSHNAVCKSWCRAVASLA